ncbi:MAG: helical backbone metal receptor [Flavobacteriales bacterium]
MRIFIILFATIGLWSCAPKSKVDESSKKRIVSLNGAITETIYALNQGDNLVGVDVTSTYPAEVDQVEKLGYVRSVNLEKIISLEPDFVLANDGEISQEQIQTLQSAGILVDVIKRKYSVDGTIEMIQNIGELFDEKDKASALINEIKLDSLITPVQPKKVLFIYSRGPGNLLVAGTNTPASAIIELALGKNAITDVEGYVPLNVEYLIKTNPDYILMFDSGLESLGGKDALTAIEGISQTNAWKNDNIISMEGHLLAGFGPRVHIAATALNKLLYN